MKLPAHPGIYEVVDPAGKVRRLPIDSVPLEARYAPNERNKMVPVVRVEAHLRKQERTLLEFGPSGELLRSTLQRSQA